MVVLPKEYEERFCAYIDILGFRELVRGLHEGTVPFGALKKALRQIHKPPTNAIFGLDDADFRVQSISDAVVMSTVPTASGFQYLFFASEILALELLYSGSLSSRRSRPWSPLSQRRNGLRGCSYPCLSNGDRGRSISANHDFAIRHRNGTAAYRQELTRSPHQAGDRRPVFF